MFMKKAIIFILVLLANINFSNAQWQTVNFPYSGPIYCFTKSGNSIFAGTRSGIFNSVNNGNSWVSSGLKGTEIFSLMVHDNKIFAGSYNALFISEDNGVTWTNCAPEPFDSYYTLACSGNYIFAGTQNGMYISSDNGINWTSNQSIGDTINSLAVSGSYIFAGSENGLYYSLDNGISFIPTGLNVEVNTIACNGMKVFAGSYSSGIFLSEDNGLSWSQINSGPSSIYSIIIIGTKVLAANYDGLFISSDNGSNWTTVNIDYTNHIIISLAVIGTEIFAGTWSGSLFISADNGLSWALAYPGLINASYVNSITAIGSYIFADAGESGLVMYSSNNGSTWNIINSGLPGNIYSVTSCEFLGNILLGTNNGIYLFNETNSSCTTLNSNISANSFVTNESVIFAGTNNGVYSSNDNGLNWNSTSLTGIKSIITKCGPYIIAGTFGDGFSSSSDNGMSWEEINSGLSSLYVNSIFSVDSQLFAYVLNDGLLYSDNNGSDWVELNAGSGSLISSFASNGTNTFAGSKYEGVFLLNLSDSTWIPVNDGLSDTSVLTLSISGNYIFAGTNGSGVWKRPLSDFLNVEELNNGSNYIIYPNPASSKITITNNQYASEINTISLLNMSGETVLLHKFKNQTKMELDVSTLPHGFYIVKIQTREGVECEKLIISH